MSKPLLALLTFIGNLSLDFLSIIRLLINLIKSILIE
jgi:hypothetical protein